MGVRGLCYDTDTMINHTSVVQCERRFAAKVMLLIGGLCLLFVAPIAAGQTEAVVFPDAQLEQAIRDTLGILWSSEITAADLRELTELDATDYGIHDITGIEQCENLGRLTLWYNEISDISPLADLSSLWYLDLDENLVSDLSPLSGLPALLVLYASYNPINDLSPLADISSLRYLFLDGIEASDWEPLSHLTSMIVLSAESNGISHVASFAEMESLSALYLSRNEITDPSQLSVLENLCMLDLSNNQIQDASTLDGLRFAASCEDGSRLNLADNLIEDLSPLLALKDLGGEFMLDIRENPAVSHPVSEASSDAIGQLEATGTYVLYLAPLKEGVPAPDFALEAMDVARETALSSLRPRIVILDFWASWCGYCRMSLPDLNALAERFGAAVTVLGVNLDRDEADALEFLADNPVPNMTMLRGSYADASAVSLAYGDMLVNGIPHSFVIDGDGVIVYSGHPSGITETLLEGLIEGYGQEPGFLGVQHANVTDDAAATYGLDPSQSGAVVIALLPGQPAEAAGLLVGDVIVAIDDQTILDSAGLNEVVRSCPAGTQVEVRALRVGETTTVPVVLAARPSPEELQAVLESLHGVDADSSDETSNVVATVNSILITDEELEHSVQRTLSRYQQIYSQFGVDVYSLMDGAQGRVFELGIESEALELAITRSLIAGELRRRGVAVTDEEVDEEFQRQYEEFLAIMGVTDEEFQQAFSSGAMGYLQTTGSMTFDEFMNDAKNTVREDLEINAIQIAVAGPIKPTENELQAYFEENHASYDLEEQVSASHILVSTEEEAQDLLDQLGDGADFAVLAQEYSIDAASGANGGALGWFMRGQMVKEFEDVAFSTPVGEVSGVVETQYGFHIIRVTDYQAAESSEYEDVADQVLADYEAQVRSDLFSQWYSTARPLAEISILDPVLNAYLLQQEDAEEGLQEFLRLRDEGLVDEPYLDYIIGTVYETLMEQAQADKQELESAETISPAQRTEIEHLETAIESHRRNALVYYHLAIDVLGEDEQIRERISMLEQEQTEPESDLDEANLSREPAGWECEEMTSPSEVVDFLNAAYSRNQPMHVDQIVAYWDGDGEHFFVLYEKSESVDGSTTWGWKLSTNVNDMLAFINADSPYQTCLSDFFICSLWKGRYSAFYIFYSR